MEHGAHMQLDGSLNIPPTLLPSSASETRKLKPRSPRTTGKQGSGMWPVFFQVDVLAQVQAEVINMRWELYTGD